MKSTINTVCIVLLAILILDGDWKLSLPTLDTPDTVAVVYESSDTIPQPYVTGALGQIQADGLQTRIFDKDVVTGTGQVPEYLKNVIEEAIKNGLPALVIVSEGNVIKVQDLPKTEAGILGAVK